MVEIDYSQFEIVGGNGFLWSQVAVRTLPLGRIRNSDQYFLADKQFHKTGINHKNIYDQNEIEASVLERRLFLILSPFPMVKDALLFYSPHKLLVNRGFEPSQSTSFDGKNLIWQSLGQDDIWVTYSDRSTIGKLFKKFCK